MSRGNFVIFLMLLAAAAAGGSAIWFHHQQTKNVRMLLTPERASQIAESSEAILRKLKPVSNFDEKNATQAYDKNEHAEWYNVVDHREIGKSRGFINFRAALLKDQSYEWREVPSDAELGTPFLLFDYSVEFRNPRGNTVLYFDLNQGWMMPALDRPYVEVNSQVSVAPISDGLRKFFEEQFAAPADDASAPKVN